MLQAFSPKSKVQQPTVIPVAHNALHANPVAIQGALRVLESGQWSGGQEVAALEHEFQEFFQIEHAIAVASGLAAMRIALLSLGGDGVAHLVPAFACVALPNAVLAAGGTVLLADVGDDFNLAVAAERRADQREVASVVGVNTFGLPLRLPPKAEAGAATVPFIEDCSHGFSYDYANGRPAIRGDVAVVSLYPTKLLRGAGGGVILTDSDAKAEFARRWRYYDGEEADGTRLNDQMSDLTAVIARAGLEALPSALIRRREIAATYLHSMAGIEDIRLPIDAPDRVWYRFVLQSRTRSADVLIDHLGACGIEARRPVRTWGKPPKEAFPLSRQAYERAVSIPLFESLGDEEVERVIDAVLTL